MKSLVLTPLCVGVASVCLLTGCVSGNSKLQAEYDRGQSDAVKELYWAKEDRKSVV